MIRVFKDFVRSLTSPESYRDFMNYKMRYLFFYVFILMFAGSIITIGVPAAQFLADGGLGKLLKDQIPDFKVSSEEGFWIEEPLEIDEYGVLVKANSDIIREDITDLDGQYGSYDYVIIADKEQIHLQIPGEQEITARYDEMRGFSLEKADILEYIPVFYMVMLWIIVLAWLMDYGYYFLVAAVISWMAGVIASFMKLRIGSLKLFKMAVYAGTLSFVLNLIQAFLGKYVPNFSVFSYVITLGYMFFALKEYKESGFEELPPENFSGRKE